MSIPYLLTFHRDGKWYKNTCSLVNTVFGEGSAFIVGLEAQCYGFLTLRRPKQGRSGLAVRDSPCIETPF